MVKKVKDDKIKNTELIDAQPAKKTMSVAELQKMQAMDMQGKVPGKGSLFHVEAGKHLDEATRLNAREIWLYAVVETQQFVACTPNRTQSALDFLLEKVKRYKIAEDGKGRDDQIILHQLTHEEKERIKGGLFG